MKYVLGKLIHYFNILGIGYYMMPNPDWKVKSNRRVHIVFAYPSNRSDLWMIIYYCCCANFAVSCFRWHELCHLHTNCTIYPSVCNKQVQKLPLQESEGVHATTLVTRRASLTLSELLQQLFPSLWVLHCDCIWQPICRGLILCSLSVFYCIHLFIYLFNDLLDLMFFQQWLQDCCLTGCSTM